MGVFELRPASVICSISTLYEIIKIGTDLIEFPAISDEMHVYSM